jgi:hypothetical protein
MDLIRHFGKMLLLIAVPSAFAVVSAIVISALFATIGVLMGHNSFSECFQHMIGMLTIITAILSLLGTIMFFSNRN